MTSLRTQMEIQLADERTVIDGTLRDKSRFVRPPQIRHARSPLASRRLGLALLGVVIALGIVIVLAVSEHKEANSLRAALRSAELVSVQIGSEPAGSVSANKPPRAGSDDVSREASPVHDGRKGAERRATDFIIANNYSGALRELEVLSRRFPGDKAYGDLVVALRWQLGCGHRVWAGGRGCDRLF